MYDTQRLRLVSKYRTCTASTLNPRRIDINIQHAERQAINEVFKTRMHAAPRSTHTAADLAHTSSPSLIVHRTFVSLSLYGTNTCVDSRAPR